MRIVPVLGIIIVIGIAAYFTKPTIEEQQAAATTWFEQAQKDATQSLDLGAALGYGVVNLVRGGTYIDDYVMSRYIVTVGDEPYLKCYGAFTKVKCDAVEKKSA